ncbi:MAG: hypothetical protein DMD41_14635, partial [Gemmatimonadetes bacterium]
MNRRWTLLLLGAAACSGDAPLAPPSHPPPPLQPPAVEPSIVAYNAVRAWTVILRDTAGQVWIAQTDPTAQPGTTEAGGRRWSASLWARLDSAPVAQALTLRTWVLAHRDQAGATSHVVVVLRWVLEDQGTALASGDE